MDRHPIWQRSQPYLVEAGQFLRYLVQQFFRDRCGLVASALTLTSLFALVPVLAVSLSVLTTFPAFERLGHQLQEFVFRNFVPTTSTVVQEYLLLFVEKTSQLRLVGVLLFVVNALFLIGTIDKAFNDIWRVTRRRGAIRAFLVYWAILTWGPLLLGLSVGLTSYFVSFPMVSGAVEQFGLSGLLYTLIPFGLTAVALILLYTTVPNRRVYLFHAAIGGLIAAILFELAKRGFAFYVTVVPIYRTVFGALAALPLFLLWIYLSWLVVLLGVEIVRCLAVYPSQRRSGLEEKFTLSYRVLGHLWDAHQVGQNLGLEQVVELEPAVSEGMLREALMAMDKADLIARLENGCYQLARDLRRFTLAEFQRVLPWRLPTLESISRSTREDAYRVKRLEAYFRVLEKASQALYVSLNVSLETLYREERKKTIKDERLESPSPKDLRLDASEAPDG